jgi:hypothetical protein
MVEVLYLFGCHDVEEFDEYGVDCGTARFRRLGGEVAKGLQRADGGQQKSFVAGAMLGAGDGLYCVLLLVAVLRFGTLGLLGADPAVHGFAEDSGALRLRKRMMLARRGAVPANLDLAEVAADDATTFMEFVGDLNGGIAVEPQAFDVGEQLPFLIGIFFFDCDFIHFLREY